MKPDKDIIVRKVTIPAASHKMPALILSPKEVAKNAPGVLWIHGGGYIFGMKEMVHMSRAVDLVKRYGAGPENSQNRVSDAALSDAGQSGYRHVCG